MTSQTDQRPAAASGTYALGGVLPVHRLGYGAMRLTGRGIWGDPRDPDEAIRVLRRAIELGVTFIDTADSYGPFVADHLIRKALHPYADDLVIATKAGLTRAGPDDWRVCGRPEYLRQQTELNLRHLGLERIDLLQLHRIDPAVPLEDQLGELVLLQQEGKIAYLGLSEVTIDEIQQAQQIATIVSVQNLYNVADRRAADVLDYVESEGMAFIPWFPMATGKLARRGGPLDALSQELGATPGQLAIAWLLRRSPAMLPIPGTSRVSHLEQNIAAAEVVLTDEQFDGLSNAT